jgi:hypothetical protein
MTNIDEPGMAAPLAGDTVSAHPLSRAIAGPVIIVATIALLAALFTPGHPDSLAKAQTPPVYAPAAPPAVALEVTPASESTPQR